MTERYTCAQEEERRNYVKNCFEHKWTHDFRPIHGPWPWSFSKVRPFSFGRNIGHKIKSFRRREEFQSCERERELSFKCTVVIVVEFLSFVANDTLRHARRLCLDIHLVPSVLSRPWNRSPVPPRFNLQPTMSKLPALSPSVETLSFVTDIEEGWTRSRILEQWLFDLVHTTSWKRCSSEVTWTFLRSFWDVPQEERKTGENR